MVLPTSVLDPNIITGDTFDIDDNVELNEDDIDNDNNGNLLFLNTNILQLKIIISISII